MAKSELQRALVEQVRADCKRANVRLDVYDVDFIAGSIMRWLGNNNAALTVTGVRRFRRKKPEKIGDL